jgi:hypothetical protein
MEKGSLNDIDYQLQDKERGSEKIKKDQESIEGADDYECYIDDDYINDDDEDGDISLDDLYEENMVDENIEYIDDIDGLRELLYDEEELSKVAYEEFPGFIRIKKGNN